MSAEQESPGDVMSFLKADIGQDSVIIFVLLIIYASFQDVGFVMPNRPIATGTFLVLLAGLAYLIARGIHGLTGRGAS